jgi:hypothetical protein
MLRLFLKSSNNCSGRSFVKMSAIWLRDITCMYNNSVQWRSEVKQRIMRLSRVSQVSNHKSYSSLLRQRQCCLLLFNINTQNILKLISTLCMKMLLKVKYMLYMFCPADIFTRPFLYQFDDFKNSFNIRQPSISTMGVY